MGRDLICLSHSWYSLPATTRIFIAATRHIRIQLSNYLSFPVKTDELRESNNINKAIFIIHMQQHQQGDSITDNHHASRKLNASARTRL